MKQVNQNQILKLKLDKTRRIIVTSDIHGDLQSFKGLLKKVNYSKADYLFIVGDLVNRRQEGIKVIDYILELKKTNDIYVVLGNNDLTFLGIKNIDPTRLAKFIARKRRIQVFYEVFKNYGIEVDEEFSIDILLEYKDRILKDYEAELAFIEQLPLIIETDKLIFAHAGITPDPIYEQDFEYVIDKDLFFNTDYSFSKIVFVGHYPVSAYYHQISTYNPLIDLKRNIVCLDGGNTIKEDGQLNAVLISNEEELNITTDAFDLMQEVTVKEDFYLPTPNPVSIIWNQDALEVIEKREKDSTVSFKNQLLNIDNDFLYTVEDKTYTYDMVNYLLPVKANDKVKLTYIYDDYCFVKKDGIRGKIARSSLDLQGEVFRRASYKEVRDISELCNKIKENYKLWDDNYPTYEHFYDDYSQGNLYCLVVDGDVVGSISIEPTITKNKFSISVSRFLVAIKKQNKGYGRKIFTYIEEVIKERKYHFIELLVHAKHPFAFEMYPSFGYTNLGKYQTPWGDDEYYLFRKKI